jgi:hypothetical protein
LPEAGEKGGSCDNTLAREVLQLLLENGSNSGEQAEIKSKVLLKASSESDFKAVRQL